MMLLLISKDICRSSICETYLLLSDSRKVCLARLRVSTCCESECSLLKSSEVPTPLLEVDAFSI